MIYLASPYSHLDPAVRQQRFEAACQIAAALIRQGEVVYSPIVYGHSLCQYGLPTDWAFWERYDIVFLEKCKRLVVLTLDGWQESMGVRAEMETAAGLGKPIAFLSTSEIAVENPGVNRG